MTTEVITGLSGTEIIKDVLSQIEARLKKDCNLRGSDAYSRGYSANIQINLELYGLDKTPIEADIRIGKVEDDTEIEVVHEKIEIKQEEDLTVVRDRIPEEKHEPENNLEMDGEGQLPARRTYAKKLPTPSDGGTEEFVE
jgi:hypothetical protein